MRLLVINANTSDSVTEICRAAAVTVAMPGTEVVGLTGRFGARIIESRAQNAIAVHALLELVAEYADSADAILIAVSYDTGLLEARELTSIPVIGMTQAALIAAAARGERIGLVTFGTPDLYRELAARYGMADRIAAVRVLPVRPEDAYADPAGVLDAMRGAVTALFAEDGVDVAVACGAAMAGVSIKLAGEFERPLIDGVVAGVGLCEALCHLPGRASPRPGAARPSVGLPEALAKKL